VADRGWYQVAFLVPDDLENALVNADLREDELEAA
jgi:hypothetical protein